MNKNQPFKIYYTVLPSKLIFNECGPESAGPIGWSDKIIKQRQKLAEQYIEKLNKQNNFYNNLEKSILKEGFRNPILAKAGWCLPKKYISLPDNMKNNFSELLICDSNGGSRLWIAQKYNLDIPCIISDFIDRFFGCKELKTIEDIYSCYKDKPKRIFIDKTGVSIDSLPHIHLES